MKVIITIEIDATTTPPLVSVTTDDEAADPAQTSIEDYFDELKMKPDYSQSYRDYDKHRKGVISCSRCGRVGYNIRTHDRHKYL